MEEQKEIIKMFMPVIKSAGGKFVGILSDTSIDRDNELMSKELLESWAENVSLKALANHENKMQSWVGGWRNLKTVNKDDHTALMAEPWFFSSSANPLAGMIQKQVEEALENGESAGISIGAGSLESVQKEIDGKKYKVYTKAELYEATWVPIQSNRNATFGHIAKSFDIDCTVCETEVSKKCDIQEEKKMSDEIIADESVIEPVVVETIAEVDEELEKLKKENSELKLELEKSKTEFKELENKAIMKATVEAIPNENIQLDKAVTIEEMIRLKLGGTRK